MPSSNTCRILQAIEREASDVRMGLSMTCGDDEAMDIARLDAERERAKHIRTCPICSHGIPSPPACTWIHEKMSEFRAVQIGLLVGYADLEQARIVKLQTLDEIQAHISVCLECRAEFRQYLSEFMR